jgi:hypothetical protein
MVVTDVTSECDLKIVPHVPHDHHDPHDPHDPHALHHLFTYP